MADYSNSKGPLGSVYPDNATDTAWNRLEPLITPDQLRTHHLFGIPLVSAMRDPITNKSSVMTDDILKEIIVRAVSIVEQDTGLDIFPVQRQEKYPFDRCEYEAFGYFQLRHRPCSSIEKLEVLPANNQAVYDVPLEWIETAYFPQGQVNIIPLTIAINSSGFVPVQSAGGAVFLSIFANRPWMPAFWGITYTSGYPDGKLPRIVNELIGVVAAIEVLAMLATTYARNSSSSLGIDGLSQSVSTPGPQLFQPRLELLAEKKRGLIAKLKTAYGMKLFSGNI